jgi:hypothetical protein
MSDKALSTILHTVEALAVLGISVAIAYMFPEHAKEALAAAFTILSFLIKGARVSCDVPIPDYVNPPQEKS